MDNAFSIDFESGEKRAKTENAEKLNDAFESDKNENVDNENDNNDEEEDNDDDDDDDDEFGFRKSLTIVQLANATKTGVTKINATNSTNDEKIIIQALKTVQQSLIKKCQDNDAYIKELEARLKESNAILTESEALLTKHNIPLPTRTFVDEKTETDITIDKKLSTEVIQNRDVEEYTSVLDQVKQHARQFRTYISYRDLGIWTMLPKADIPTVGGALVKCLCGSGTLNRVDILKGLSGRILPGKLTLLLGPPGSGKSTFLKALSDRLRIGGKLHRDGHIYYNEEEIDSDKFLARKITSYVEQEENHAPTLTVEETLEYAWRTTTGGHHSYALAKDQESVEALDNFDDHLVKVKSVMKILGISGVANTYVGDGAIRGVSGGQKRRVTLGEMAVTPRKIFFMDCISNGLDSKTTFEIMQAIRAYNQIFNSTIVVALLQPPPEVYDLFDEIILLHEGQIIYQGPREDVMPYFNSLGYHCPDNMDIADFLQIIPTIDGRFYLQDPLTDPVDLSTIKELTSQNISELEGKSDSNVKLEVENTFGIYGEGRPSYHKANQVITFENHGTESFVSAWKASSLYNNMMARIDHIHKSIQSGDDNLITQEWPADMKEKMPGSFYFNFSLALKRQRLLFGRDTIFITMRLVQQVLVGSIGGALFNNIATDNVQSTLGFLYFGALYGVLGQFSFVPGIYKQKSIFKKQEDALMVTPSIFNLCIGLITLPLLVVETVLFGTIMYWSAGMCDEGGRFLTYLLINLVASLSIGTFFRAISFATSSQNLSLPLCGILIMLTELFSGFILPPGQIPDWWIWFYYLNPVAYVFKALVVNQYTCPRYDFVQPGSSIRYGDVVLEAYGLPTDYAWVWYSFVILVLLYGTFSVVSFLVLNYVKVEISPPPPIIIASAKDDEAMKTICDDNSKSIELPFDSCAFAFKNISYSVITPDKEELQLLSNVTGYFEPGTMTALMGTSGAGKTTLLDVLSGRKTTGTITGEMYINGKPKDQKHFKRIMAYVEQFDTLSPNETTRDAIEFSAALRLPPSVSEADRQKWVDAVIVMLELAPIENVIVGKIEEGGMSFEQKKRLSIGVELASNPAILFLDEPTTGLESRAAQVVMRSIRRVASSGRSIVCTIHQPSYPIFSGFDSLLLLRRGGQTVYFGQLGDKCKNLIDFFQAAPDVTPMHLNQNPATYMLDVLAASNIDFHHYYNSSQLCEVNTLYTDGLCTRVEAHIIDGVTENTSLIKNLENKMESPYLTSYLHQFKWIFYKLQMSYWRTPSYNFARFLLAILTAFIFSSAYPNQTYYNPADVIARYGLIYSTTLFLGVEGMDTVIHVTSEEIVAYYREQQSMMYSPLIYSLCQLLVEIPYIIVSSLLFVLPYFFFVGFQNVGNTAAKFGYYWLFVGLFEAMLINLGQMLVASTPSEQTAGILSGVLSTLFSMFAGFMINPADIPSFFQFVYWLDPLHYALQGLIFTQFKGDTTLVTLTNGAQVTAEEFTNQYFPTWSYSDINWSILALFLFIIFNKVLNTFSLTYLRFNKR